jgi:hypothetical protein
MGKRQEVGRRLNANRLTRSASEAVVFVIVVGMIRYTIGEGSADARYIQPND